jgi:molybdopterin molybdotransferase
MTGAPVPPGADAVMMVEYTKASAASVEIERSVKAGENVVARGSEAKQGALLLQSGTAMGPAHVAVCVSVGRVSPLVYRRARVAIISTGDEIVDARHPRVGHYQIRNSNSYSLAQQVIGAGGIADVRRTVVDEVKAIRGSVQQSLTECELVVLSGGVSMGKYDLVEQVLEELGAEFYFTGVKIQPGKPVVFGKVRGKYFFGLPGNPVSTMVTFELFVRPMIEALGGGRPSALKYASAVLKREFKTKTGLTRFLPAILSGGPEKPEVELVAWQGSGDIAAMSRANCYLVVPEDKEVLNAGEYAAVLLPQ